MEILFALFYGVEFGIMRYLGSTIRTFKMRPISHHNISVTFELTDTFKLYRYKTLFIFTTFIVSIRKSSFARNTVFQRILSLALKVRLLQILTWIFCLLFTTWTLKILILTFVILLSIMICTRFLNVYLW